jgi:uncharacterized membrane protein
VMPMWGGPWGGPWYGMGWFMPLLGFLVMLGVMVWVLRSAGGHGSDVSRELAALRRDIQDLTEEVRKLRDERKGSGSAGR